MHKSFASVSLDLDNKWAYLNTRGLHVRESDSYLDILTPRLLDFLKAHHLKATIFVVGKDAAWLGNREALRSIGDAGHEIGNHSFHHNPWLHAYTEDQVYRELALAEECIERATGQRPVGFRGPGFSLSATLLSILAKRGYLYDSTLLPSILNPLARAYFLMSTDLSREEKQLRNHVFGSFTDGFRPLKSFQWRLGSLHLTEIPVTTMPILRFPFHVSYILYLSGYSPRLALYYFRLALRLCRLTGTEPSLLLHSLDFLGKEDVQDLSFFPGMHLSYQQKIEVLSEVFEVFCQEFTVLTIRQHATKHAKREGGYAIPFAPNYRYDRDLEDHSQSGRVSPCRQSTDQ
jgi:hypothetical protein